MPALIEDGSHDGIASDICPNCHSRRIRHFDYSDATIHVCRSCKLQWASFHQTGGFVSLENRSVAHERYMDPNLVDTPSYRPYREFWRTLRYIRGDTSLKVLDIGCGNGLFISECVRRGHDAHGVDADISNKRLIDPAIRERVTFCRAENLPPDDERYDLITFWDSFEHMPEPFLLLELLATRLKPDGIIFLRVNDQRDIVNWTAKLVLSLNSRFGKKLFRICFNLPHHYWNFSHRTMEQMLKRIEWHIIFARSTETPANRLFASRILRAFVLLAYAINTLFAGGKIREYFIRPKS